jgi:spermidine/putrescine-binding protein
VRLFHRNLGGGGRFIYDRGKGANVRNRTSTYRSLIGCCVVGALVALTAASSGAAAQRSGSAARASGSLVDASFGGQTAIWTEQYIFKPFGQQTGIKTTVLTIPGQQVAGITAQNKAHKIVWDMTDKLDDASMQTLEADGYLATMPPALFAKIKKIIPSVKPYAIPTQVASNMLVCNSKIVTNCPTDAKDFFNTTQFPGPRMLSSFQPLVAIATALEAAGVPASKMWPNSEAQSMKNVKLAEKYLNQLKPSIKTFYSSSNQALQLLDTGEVTMGSLWNFAAARGAANPTSNMVLKTTWNDAVNFISYDVVYKGAPNEANAWTLENWMIDNPKAVAQLTQQDVGQGVADPRVFKLVPAADRKWMASKVNRPPSVDTDIIWYGKFPAVQKEINNFWKSYTS